MTELLVIKAGKEYYRFNEGNAKLCRMKKASVFSLAEVQAVRKWCERLQHSGVPANIVKLTILEEPFLE